MPLPIPVELLTLLGSGAMAGVMTLWSQSMKAKAENNKIMMERIGQQAQIFDEVRKTKVSKGFSFTRRVIAIMAAFSIILLPKLVAVWKPEVAVIVGYTEWNPGFWIFEGSNATEWKSFSGLVMTPLDTHLMSSIIGLYFGSSMVKN